MASENLAHGSEAERIREGEILAACRHPFVRSPRWLPWCGVCGQVLVGPSSNSGAGK